MYYLLLTGHSPHNYSTLHFPLKPLYALKTIDLKTSQSKRVQKTFQLCFVEFPWHLAFNSPGDVY